jgi:hypothetical protein
MPIVFWINIVYNLLCTWASAIKGELSGWPFLFFFICQQVYNLTTTEVVPQKNNTKRIWLYRKSG